MFFMSRSGREALSDIQERSGGPLGCPEAVGRLSRISDSGREALPECPGGVGSGREAHLDIREWLGDPPGLPGVYKRPSLMLG